MFKIIDIKNNKVVLNRISETEAHKRVDLLNSCGIIRYKAQRI